VADQIPKHMNPILSGLGRNGVFFMAAAGRLQRCSAIEQAQNFATNCDAF